MREVRCEEGNEARTRFKCHLVNSIIEDPALLVYIEGRRESILIDCGEIGQLSESELLKIDKILISHTHVDHFIGFDDIIRVNVGVDKELHVFGPCGIPFEVQHKFLAYQWNLLDESGIKLIVHEIKEDEVVVYELSSKSRFTEIVVKYKHPFGEGVIYRDKVLRIEAAVLDHKIPSVAYALVEEPFYNIDKSKLDSFSHSPGPWLKNLKEALLKNASSNTMIQANKDSFTLDFLKKILVNESPGQRIAYVTDTILSSQTQEKILKLAKGALIFFCEFYFLQRDIEKAMERHHLTARQAGELARLSGVRKLVGFHYSPKYIPDLNLVTQEAHDAFLGKKQ